MLIALILLFSVGAAKAFSICPAWISPSRTRTPAERRAAPAVGVAAFAFGLPRNSHHVRKPTSLVASTLQRTGDATDETHDEGGGGHYGDDCEVLLLDHLNINHEKGRHDIVKAFYFDFLGLAVDPRKYENIAAGSKTLWANVGLHQFHLPEGKPDAQVFDGTITLVYGDLDTLIQRYNDFVDDVEPRFRPLKDTEFSLGVLDSDMMMVTCPWGSQFILLRSHEPDEDRAAHLGSQPLVDGHEPSEGLKMEDLTVFVENDSNLEGIGRFYEKVLGAVVVPDLSSESSISIAMGQSQTLTFQHHPDGSEKKVVHHDFSDAGDENYPANYGPHISLYVTNLPKAYQAAGELGVLYVNPRFKRRAYTEDEAIDQCMFRIIDIVDPLDEDRTVICRLEHEVRSAKTRDGKKYKSFPLKSVT